MDTMFHLPSIGSDYLPSDSELMYVDLDVQQYESENLVVPYYEISTNERYGDSISRDSPSNCEIEYIEPDEDSASSGDWTEVLFCVLDVPEWLFVVTEFHLVYNFPEGMCKDAVVALPWHFNYPIQPGPVVRECTKPSSNQEGSENQGESGYCDNSVSSGYGSCAGCNVSDEENLCGVGGNTGIPKCCFGGRKTDGSIWEPDPECFGGPAFVTSNFSDVDQATRRVITPLPEGGFRQTISFRNLVEVNGNQSIGRFVEGGSNVTGYASSSAPYANYLKALDKELDDLRSVNRDDLPHFLQPGNYKAIPRLFFEFDCLDEAGELVHGIRLMIREWNTMEEFSQFYADGGNDTSDPDVEGEEGDECEYEDRSILEDEFLQCNDLLDLDDVADCDSDLYPVLCSLFGTGQSQYPRIRYAPIEEESSSGGSGNGSGNGGSPSGEE